MNHVMFWNVGVLYVILGMKENRLTETEIVTAISHHLTMKRSLKLIYRSAFCLHFFFPLAHTRTRLRNKLPNDPREWKLVRFRMDLLDLLFSNLAKEARHILGSQGDPAWIQAPVSDRLDLTQQRQSRTASGAAPS